MAIPPEIQELIPQVRRQFPQLAAAPDEVVAIFIQQAIESQKSNLQTPHTDEELNAMHPQQLGAIGEQMLNIGRWGDAEKYFSKALENAEKISDPQGQMAATESLALLSRYRGNMARAMELYRQTLTLAERWGDCIMIGASYHGIGTVFETAYFFKLIFQYIFSNKLHFIAIPIVHNCVAMQ